MVENSKQTREVSQLLGYLREMMNEVVTNRVFILPEVMYHGVETRPLEIYNEILLAYSDV